MRNADGSSILDYYLQTQLDPNYVYKNIQEANIFLAEDRILCLNIYAKPFENYKLVYLPDAEAMVDPMEDIIGLIK